MRSKGRKKNAPPSAAYRRNVNRLIPVNVRERNKPSGIIGAALCCSAQRNTTRSSEPTTTDDMTVGFRQPRSDDAINPKTRLPNPANASSAPTQSSPGLESESWLSGTYRSAIQIAGSATNGLTRKIQ